MTPLARARERIAAEEGRPMVILSLGAGVQSTTLALMAAHGEVEPMPDCAIFADTEGEPDAVYQHLAWLQSPGILPYPIHRVTSGSLWKSATTVRTTKDGERRYIKTALPVYMVDGLRRGRGQRHCTRDFKITPVNREARTLLGRPRIPKSSGILVEMWMGISRDEALRAKQNPYPWIQARRPLIELKMSRSDCLNWMKLKGYPTPPRSACTYCAFHNDAEWLRLTPEEFADAIAKEQELQAAYAAASEIDGVPFFHASRVPLGQVRLKAAPDTGEQLSIFNNECEGMCGVRPRTRRHGRRTWMRPNARIF